MSRGISKLQQRILDTLGDGLDRSERFYNPGPLDTPELLESLEHGGFFPDNGGCLRHRLFAVRRACRSLERRGLIRGEKVIAVDCGPRPVCWEIVATATSSA